MWALCRAAASLSQRDQGRSAPALGRSHLPPGFSGDPPCSSPQAQVRFSCTEMTECSKKSHPGKCSVCCSKRCWYFEEVNSVYLDQISGGSSVGRILWVGVFYKISYWPTDKILIVNADTDILILYKKIVCVLEWIAGKWFIIVSFHVLRGILFEICGVNAYKFQINAFC